MNDKELPKPGKDYLEVKQNGKQEKVFPDYPKEKDRKGNEELAEKYNINDQAHLNSSKDDFVETVSNFHHAEEDEATKK